MLGPLRQLEFFVSVISAGMEGVSVGGIGVSVGAIVAVFSTTTTIGVVVGISVVVAAGSGTTELTPGKLQASVAMIKAATINKSSRFNFKVFSSGWE
jgi:hypothetical protein